MKKYHLILLFFLFHLGTIVNSHEDKVVLPIKIKSDISCFEIGMDISYLNLPFHNQGLMINSSSILPFFVVISDDVSYKVAYENNIIQAIFVNEYYSVMEKSFFETPEGVFIGMEYAEVCKLLPHLTLKKIVGWGYTGELPSGWKIVFFTGSTMTDYIPKAGDKVGAIYKAT